MSTTLSLEDDQLSFLYCFLLLCLDSIIYGLLALAVTKVVDPSPSHHKQTKPNQSMASLLFL